MRVCQGIFSQKMGTKLPLQGRKKHQASSGDHPQAFGHTRHSGLLWASPETSERCRTVRAPCDNTLIVVTFPRSSCDASEEEGDGEGVLLPVQRLCHLRTPVWQSSLRPPSLPGIPSGSLGSSWTPQLLPDVSSSRWAKAGQAGDVLCHDHSDIGTVQTLNGIHRHKSLASNAQHPLLNHKLHAGEACPTRWLCNQCFHQQ